MTIALVGSPGAVATVASGNTITPTFGQATTAGNMLIARLAAPTIISISWTPPAGWTIAAQSNGAIAYKANCAAGESAPTFTCSNTLTLYADVTEWSGVGLLDKVNAGGHTNAGGDTNTSDLAIYVAAWSLSKSATTTFTDAWTPSGGTVAAAQGTGATKAATVFWASAYLLNGNGSSSFADQDIATVTPSTGTATLQAESICSFKPAVPTAPAAPTGVAVAGTGSADLAITWTDETTGFPQSTYSVIRGTDNITFATTVASGIAQGTQTATDTTTTPGTQYYYKVTATNSSGSATSATSASGEVITASSTGTAADSASVAVTVTASDTATSTNTASTLTATGTASDARTGTDSASLAVTLTASDSGALAEAPNVAQNVPASDSGTATEGSYTVALSAADARTGAETATPAPSVTTTDAGTESEALALNATLTDADSGAASDATTLGLTRSDSAAGTDSGVVYSVNPMPPDAVLAAANIDNTLATIQDDPDAPDGVFDQAVIITVADDMRVSFGSTGGSLKTGGPYQEFRTYLRPSGG